MKIFVPLVALLLFSSVLFSQSTYSPEVLEKIREVENSLTGSLILNDERPYTISERMAKHHVKGMSIAVIHDYKIEWAKGYGWADESEKRPVTTETLFEPGSISKSLNAVGILKLAQEKKLDLDTDINTYLTSWKFPYDSLSNGKKITLAQILSHNAGLSTHGFAGHNLKGKIPSITDVLDGKAPATSPPVRSEFEPGLKFQYSGGGTTISQMILTNVTGQPYDAWMYDNVLKPIGMVNSTYAQPPAKDKQKLCATAYYRDGSPLLNKFHVYPEQAAAGLWMTPSDLSRYVIDMQLAYKGSTSKVLNPEMVKLHLTPYNNGPTALGTFIDDMDGAKYFQHSAGNDGFCGFFYASLEEGYGLVVFLNSEDGGIMPEMINSVAKAYQWKNFYREPRKMTTPLVKVSDEELKSYEGIYLFDDSWAAIGQKAGQYHFHVYGTDVDMYFSAPGRFFNAEFSAVKEFTKDAKGNITGYTRTADGKEFPSSVRVAEPDTIHLQSNLFTEIGWYLVETGKYGEALAYFKRGSELYPQDLNMTLNLAHLYLLNGDYKSGLAIYKAHLKDNVQPTMSWKEGMQNDFIYFKEHRYDVRLFDKVFAELKVEKPQGY